MVILSTTTIFHTTIATILHIIFRHALSSVLSNCRVLYDSLWYLARSDGLLHSSSEVTTIVSNWYYHALNSLVSRSIAVVSLAVYLLREIQSHKNAGDAVVAPQGSCRGCYVAKSSYRSTRCVVASTHPAEALYHQYSPRTFLANVILITSRLHTKYMPRMQH